MDILGAISRESSASNLDRLTLQADATVVSPTVPVLLVALVAMV